MAQLGIEPRLPTLCLKSAGLYIAGVLPLDHCAFLYNSLSMGPYNTLFPMIYNSKSSRKAAPSSSKVAESRTISRVGGSARFQGQVTRLVLLLDSSDGHETTQMGFDSGSLWCERGRREELAGDKSKKNNGSAGN